MFLCVEKYRRIEGKAEKGAEERQRVQDKISRR